MQATTSPQLDRRLFSAAEAIRNTDLFSGLSDETPLAEKQALFLVVAGRKPVSEVTSGHWVHSSDGRQAEPDDPGQVGEFLERVGLVHYVTSDACGTDAIVAQSHEHLLQFQKAFDARTAGELFGYPATAVDAYVREQLLPLERQLLLEKGAGLPVTFFRFSAEHLAAELSLALSWWATLSRYDLV